VGGMGATWSGRHGSCGDERGSKAPRHPLVCRARRWGFGTGLAQQETVASPTAKTRAVGEETLSQQENSAVGKEIFANSPKSKD
jgi:hypothetical protein